ncbi:phosphatidylglycerophosphatase B [Clostridium homopropionicum DSM 5847]|uniref:Phosphatidylglycerophosphatase B n=1 Tax=Clostridium homopropionicum DSM 5847 TaxID=1121318 RepID=A0A0L6ZEJ3_9CLOT|nr:phosphatase PAP2 family protein [Clostridium homopropionicum]KOA21396.1 phosphatidylglycerophosphatase B [Clostridium homopropionicum DSM 5847]SFG11263.1 undecaprenyl-diphosphatase [Clostridium homopropionicum]
MYLMKTKPDKVNNPVYYIYLVLIMSIGWIGLFIVKLRDSFVEGGGEVDRAVISYVSGIRNEYLNKIFVIISRSGDTVVAIILTLLIVIFLFKVQKKREAKFYAINIFVIAALSQGLKYLSKRPRPVGQWLVDISGYTNVGGYSFPSGHSTISMAGALVVIYFILDNFRNRILAHILSIIIFVYAALVGISRVYVGVHYFSDVIGAWAIASLWVLIILIVFRRESKRKDYSYLR